MKTFLGSALGYIVTFSLYDLCYRNNSSFFILFISYFYFSIHSRHYSEANILLYWTIVVGNTFSCAIFSWSLATALKNCLLLLWEKWSLSLGYDELIYLFIYCFSFFIAKEPCFDEMLRDFVYMNKYRENK